MDYKLFWTEEAIRNLEEILDYLVDNWSQKEVEGFKEKLSKQLDLILINPKMFPVSSYNPRLRKAVLSKQTTVAHPTNFVLSFSKPAGVGSAASIRYSSAWHHTTS